jgi:hypothetical protein
MGIQASEERISGRREPDPESPSMKASALSSFKPPLWKSHGVARIRKESMEVKARTCRWAESIHYSRRTAEGCQGRPKGVHLDP